MARHYSGRYDSNGKGLYIGEYQRSSGTYQYKYKDKEGRRQTISATTLKELREMEDRCEKDSADGLKVGKQKQTVNDMFETWKQVKRGLKPNVKANYIYMYDRFVRNSLGKMKLVDVKHTDVQKFYAKVHDEKNVAVNTLDSIQTVLHQVLEIAVLDDIIRYNPADKALKELRTEERRKKEKGPVAKVHVALTLEEQDRLTEFLLSNDTYRHWYPIIILMLDTGMRVGEADSLRWEDIDFDEGVIDVNHDMVSYKVDGHGLYVVKINDMTKTKAGMRKIPMTKRVREALLMQKEYMKDMKCRSSLDGYTDFVFLNRFGSVLREGCINKAMRERIWPEMNAEGMRMGKVQVRRIATHGLRHTFCTNLCRAGVPIKVIMDVMGHEDIQTTMGIYAEATADMKKGAVEDLERYLGEGGRKFPEEFRKNAA